LFLLICGAVFVVFILMACLGSYYIFRTVNEDSAEAMIMMADQKSRELNVHFEGVERAVEMLEDHICDNLDPERMKTDREYMKEFMAEVEDYGTATANVAGNVATWYFRPDPVIFDERRGWLHSGDAHGYLEVRQE